MIIKTYTDPITGTCSPTPPTHTAMTGLEVFPTVNFMSDSHSGISIEHVNDAELKSLTLNCIFHWGKKQSNVQRVNTLDWLNPLVFAKLDRVIPSNLDYGVQNVNIEDSEILSVSIPNYSKFRYLNTEMLAESILKVLVDMLVKCDKCGYIVVPEDGICPECGAELIVLKTGEK